jgi:hypothetical protein
LSKVKKHLKRFVRAYVIISFLILAFGVGNAAHAVGYPVPRLFQGTRTAIAHVGFSPTVIAVGTERAFISGMPIIERPYRPFHFYGNTVRRRYYRQLYRWLEDF